MNLLPFLIGLSLFLGLGLVIYQHRKHRFRFTHATKFDQIGGVLVVRQGEKLTIHITQPGDYEIEAQELDIGFGGVITTRPSHVHIYHPYPVTLTIRLHSKTEQTLKV